MGRARKSKRTQVQSILSITRTGIGFRILRTHRTTSVRIGLEGIGPHGHIGLEEYLPHQSDIRIHRPIRTEEGHRPPPGSPFRRFIAGSRLLSVLIGSAMNRRKDEILFTQVQSIYLRIRKNLMMMASAAIEPRYMSICCQGFRMLVVTVTVRVSVVVLVVVWYRSLYIR